MTYDDRGRMTQTVQDFVDSEGVPQSYATTMTYNDRDLLETRTLPTGAVETFTYDAEERITAQVDADGVLRETDYGPFSQVAELREDGELVERTEFGTLDLPARVFRGDNTKLREMTYDAWGRPRTMESGTGEELVFTYDGGYINTVTLPPYNGQPDILEVQFNQQGKLLSVAKTYPDGTGTTSYEYDGEDRRTAIIDPRGGRMSFTYDLLGRMESYTDKLGKTKFWTYDADGRELSMTNRNGEVLTRTYDEAGRLETISEAAVGTFTYGYDAASRVSTLTRPNGMVTTHSYDDSGRVTALVTELLGSEIHSITTTYDDRGIPATQTDQEGTHVYQHDQRGRLTGVDHPDGAAFGDESYAYDQAERRTESHRDPASEVVYDDGDRLVQDATYTYQYDDEGRRVGRTHRVTGVQTTYAYSVLDQLLSLEEGDERWEYVYDARELRVRSFSTTTGSQEITDLVYDQMKKIRWSCGTSGSPETYLLGYGIGGVLAVGNAPALQDRLGTTVAVVEGTQPSEVRRDAFGNSVQATAAPTPDFPGYTGHVDDPTGLIWARARFMDPAIGSWLTEDPNLLEPRFAYAQNRPSYMVDATGCMATSYASKGTAILGATGGLIYVADQIACSLTAIGSLVTQAAPALRFMAFAGCAAMMESDSGRDDDDDCGRARDKAYDRCKEYLGNPTAWGGPRHGRRDNHRLRGGHRTFADCVKGYLPAHCGGNPF